jgi:alpha-galactosidase
MPPKDVSRRKFLSRGLLSGAAAALGSRFRSVAAMPQKGRASSKPRASTFFDLLRVPDSVTAYDGSSEVPLVRSGSKWSANGIIVNTEPRFDPLGQGRLPVTLAAPQRSVSRVHLRWRIGVPSGLRLLGDHWERGYGDLEWRAMVGERVMPWYFLVHDGWFTHGYGVQTAPKAMAFWRVDDAGVSLWLDVRNGGSPVLLGERTLEACTIVTRAGREGESSWQAARAFCAVMCSAPRLPSAPVYGGNNWYYAYGENCSAKAIERDAGLLADVAGSAVNRPFEVIDDGWQLASGTGCCSGGPWRYGNAGFPDMLGLAARLKVIGVRPGIWMRPLLTHERGTEAWTLKRPQAPGREGRLLDPTMPEVREHIRRDISGLVSWGYELIKHDFSTYDLFGRWGGRMGGSLTDEGWAFADRSRTTAEIARDLYNAIREGAGEHTVIIGCNTIGHLAAGLFELQRTGDDTSGHEWEGTRRMGVNTLAFRGTQHEKFFAADADCVGVTTAVPWALNKQWLDLLSRSGTPLFVSAAPDAVGSVGSEQRKVLREAFARAAVTQPVAEPLDWLESTTPKRWKLGVETVIYDWYGAKGIETVESK